MKKTKLLIIFLLGIFLGGITRQIKTQRYQLNQPVIKEGKININGLLKSISQVISTKDLKLANPKYERFDEIYNLLQNSYYDKEKLNSGLMIQSALKSYVDAIDDPYTLYMDIQQNSGFQTELKGEMNFEGIGAVVTKKDYYVMIEEVLKSSPAFDAGLIALDRIVMIDSGSTKDLDINQAVAKIRGPKGTKVKLIVERIKKDGQKEVLEKEVLRDKVLVPSVTSEIFTGKNKIGYINISIIGEETEKLLKQNINDFKNQNIKGIILDLRGNGGGLLPIAVEISSHFVPKDKVIVTAKYKIFNDEIYSSKGYSDLQNIPIVILVDGMTASAGEIIALALQEQIGAKLVGTQTFGKGSIQTMEEFTDTTSLKYTIGKRYSPSNKNIDKIGITPDYIIEFDKDKYIKDKIDNQLEKTKEVINQLIKK
ncbi:MAG: S41 family peptidase [Candidatus Absconditabacterales bacterium]